MWFFILLVTLTVKEVKIQSTDLSFMLKLTTNITSTEGLVNEVYRL